MILPAKHLSLERSISGVGAEILSTLDSPSSVSELWVKVRDGHNQLRKPITFDWYVATLTWLYAISAIEYSDGIISRNAKI